MSEAANELVDFLEGAASSLVTVNHERTVFFICKGKGMFLYSAVSSPLGLLKALYISHSGRPVNSGTNSASLGTVLAKLPFLPEDYSLKLAERRS